MPMPFLFVLGSIDVKPTNNARAGGPSLTQDFERSISDP